MNNVYRENLKEIFQSEWKSKKIWEWILEQNQEENQRLTVVPPFKGELYGIANTKIMYVGHAVNGWNELDTTGCTTLENTLDAVLKQSHGLEALVNEKGFPYKDKNGRNRVYRHINSNFFRLIKQVLEYQNESDSPTDKTWYHDSKEWQKKFVWTNLFNIAPRNGGNPDNDLIKPFMAQYTEMIKTQIEEYQPDIAIFCPLSGYFAPWVREPSFAKVIDHYQECNIDETIIGQGHSGKTEIIVCKRPDARGISREKVNNMARCISDYINDNCHK